MRILVNDIQCIRELANLHGDYSDIVCGLEELEKKFVSEFGKSMFPLVVILLKNRKDGIVESDDESFDSWTYNNKTDMYDWECEELCDQLWKNSME